MYDQHHTQILFSLTSELIFHINSFSIQRLTNAARSNPRPLLIRQARSDFVAEGELEARVARIDGLAADDATCVRDRSPVGWSQLRTIDPFK